MQEARHKVVGTTLFNNKIYTGLEDDDVMKIYERYLYLIENFCHNVDYLSIRLNEFTSLREKYGTVLYNIKECVIGRNYDVMRLHVEHVIKQSKNLEILIRHSRVKETMWQS